MSDKPRLDLKESAHSDPHIKGMIFEKLHACTPVVLTVISIGMASPSIAGDICSKLPGGNCEPTKFVAVSSSTSVGPADMISAENTAGGANVTFRVDPAQIPKLAFGNLSSITAEKAPPERVCYRI